MPRGFGDGGLTDGDDLYGVFLPHNIWAVYADRLAVEAAEILGRTEDRQELKKIYETARDDLLAALDGGAIREKDYRWIPGVPGKTSGSRWGALNAAFPCGLLPPDHPLITGTLRKIESNMSRGGIPIHTGWMADGMWVAITLDNVAETHLARGNGDAAVRYLYATLNHGTPLYTWCEERGQEPGAKRCSGDRQHLWTPVAVVRAIRDMLVMEDVKSPSQDPIVAQPPPAVPTVGAQPRAAVPHGGIDFKTAGGLQLALGTAREWLASGRPVGISNAATHFESKKAEQKRGRSSFLLSPVWESGRKPALENLQQTMYTEVHYSTGC